MWLFFRYSISILSAHFTLHFQLNVKQTKLISIKKSHFDIFVMLMGASRYSSITKPYSPSNIHDLLSSMWEKNGLDEYKKWSGKNMVVKWHNLLHCKLPAMISTSIPPLYVCTSLSTVSDDSWNQNIKSIEWKVRSFFKLNMCIFVIDVLCIII
jgi:hypothetical protein